MAISQRTATSGILTSSQVVTITLPTGTTTGDFLVVAIAEGNVSGPAAPTGWTLTGPLSAGTAQSISIYTAPYSASLTLTFTNIAAAAAWACNAFFEAGRTVSLDGTPVAAHNTTGNTTLPTGAPTTGSAAGDYEVLAYAITSNTTIATVATGSTIDRTQANGASPSVILGHNNDTSLAANTTVTAFSQTLAAANTRKTGVGILLKSVAGGPIPLTVSATQATAVSLRGNTTRLVTATASQSATLRKQTSLARAVTQAQSVSIVVQSNRVLFLTVAASQGTQVARSLVRSLKRTLSVTQATSLRLQVGTDPIARIVTATQAQAVSLRRQVALTRSIQKATSVALRRQLSLRLQTALATQSIVLLHASAVLVATQQATSVRLVRGFGLTRILSQSSSATIGKGIALARIVGQVTSAVLAAGAAGIERTITAEVLTSVSLLKTPLPIGTATQSVSVRLGRRVSLTRTVGQGQLATLLVQGIPSGGVRPGEVFRGRDRSPVLVAATRQPVFASRGRSTVFTAERSD